MKLPTSSILLLTAFIGSVAGDLPSQLATSVNNYLSVSFDLRSSFQRLPVDLDDKSDISNIVNELRILGDSINSLNTTAADLAAQAILLAPADAAGLVEQLNITAGNTTQMVSALVTKTYFCLNYGLYIDAAMVPAKETIFWALLSLAKISPEPYKSQIATGLGSLTTSLTNSYYKALVYRNYYHNFDRPCIPWGT